MWVKGTMHYMGVEISDGKVQFWGVVQPTEKHWESLMWYT